MNKIYGFLLLWLCHVALYAQFGGVDGSYDPSNPPNPEEPKTKYTLNLTASPQGAGSTNYSSPQAREEGAEVYISTSSNSGFVFQRWMEGDKMISTTPSFYYTMPAHNVELRAEYKYDPTSPANPEMRGVSYNLTLVASPTGGGSFNESFRRVEENTTTYLYAYPNSGYEFVGWQQDGQIIDTDTRFEYTMPSQHATLTALFRYNPTNPGNPGKNSWTETTGEVIVDDFTAGNLYNAIYEVTNGNNNAVTQIMVAGKMNYYDFGIANNYSNCTYLDLSRTTGLSSVPSYSYRYNSTLTAIVLPASIEELEYMAFYDCSNLAEISCYAPVPPSVRSYALEGVQEGCIVRVPATSVGLYQEADGWKDFTILPLAEEVNALEVNLPVGSEDGRYKNMFIELINTKSGQKLRYVVSDRLVYTFNSLMHYTQWNVYLKNAQDVVLGKIDNIDIKDKDVSVTFKDVLIPRNLSLSILTPEGTDVTAQATITWMDAKNTYLAQGNALSGLTDGTEVKYRVVLPQPLGMMYVLPTEQDYIVEETNNITLTLQALPHTTLSGVVRDVTTGQKISGATVSISQTLNGLYSKAQTVKTDANGTFTADIFKTEYAPSLQLSVSASNYISQTLTQEQMTTNEAGGLTTEVALKTITGATISLDFTYTESVIEGEDAETQNWYSDYANVSYSIYNETQQHNINEFNVQYPQIVLLEEVADGDELRFTATSRTNSFMPMTTTVTIADQKATAAFNITELGKISADFSTTENAAVVGILYDSKGKLLSSQTYMNAQLSFTGLADGDYTLVSMAQSNLFNSVYDLAQLPSTGLKEGVDYVQNSVTVKSGVIATISNDLVPYLDESKLYYTGDNTSFTVNKTEVTVGNYLTLNSHIDFKNAYANNVTDVKLIVDLPEESSLVDNSIMVGTTTSNYMTDGHRVTIPLNNNYSERVRFCFIPTAGGSYAPSAYVQFALNGETVIQPIGSANYIVKDLSINVPSVVAKKSFPVSGTANGKSSIEIYDNGVLIGQTTSLANGTWSTMCELNEPYNLSRHQIYAKVTTKAGLVLQSETVECQYDMKTIEAKTVTMSYFNGWLNKNIEVIFNLQEHTVNASSYMFYHDTDFTFVADLTNNDTTVVSGVTIRVYTDKGNWRNLDAKYDTSINKWIAVSYFESFELPVGVDVVIDANTNPIIDKNEMVDVKRNIASIIERIENAFSSVEALDIELSPEKFEESLKSIDETFEVDSQETYQYYKDLTDEELDRLLSELDNINYEVKMDSLNQFVEKLKKQYANDNYFQYTLEDGSVVQSESCEGIDISILEKEGFTAYNTTEGVIYFRTSKIESEFIDISQNSHITISYSNTLGPRKISASDFQAGLDKFNDIIAQLNDCYQPIAKAYEDTEKILGSFVEKAFKALRNAEDEVIKYSLRYNLQNTKLSRLEAELANTNSLSLDYVLKKAEVDACKAEVKQAKTLLNAANRCKFLANTAYNLIKPLKGVFTKSLPLTKYADVIYTGVSTVKKFQQVYIAVPRPCEDDELGADKIRGDVITAGVAAGVAMIHKVGFQAIADLATVGQVAAAPETGGISVVTAVATVAANIAISLAIDKAYNYFVDSELRYLNNEIKELRPRCNNDDKCPRCGKNPCECPNKCPKCGNRPCTCNKNCPKCGQNPCVCKPPKPQIPPIPDPSGYVYEGIASNRVQGVTATAYYKEMVEDMYGDLHENIVKWDAKEYDQENPLFTDEDGFYQWFVPQGLWQVKYEKEGYETTYSEWLPVPPPQLEVNIPMVQSRQPEVKKAYAYEDGVEIQFDKYMLPESLTPDNIKVTRNGENLEGTVELLDEEVSYEGKTNTFASRVRFVPANDETLLSTDEIVLTVSQKVKSYAGLQMQESYTQAFDVEKAVRQIVVEEQVTVPYEGQHELLVSAQPFDAAIDKTLKVKTASKMIADVMTDEVQTDEDGIMEVTLDENGQATLTLTGELPGATALTFSIEDANVTAQTMVSVKDDSQINTKAPVASRASGSALYSGTEITLSSKTGSAVIYYTLDGSCPCDETKRIKYDGPIVVTGDMTIKAMAQGSGMYESDVVTFTYTIKKTKVDVSLQEGWNWISHNMAEAQDAAKVFKNAIEVKSQTRGLINDSKFGMVGNLKELLPTAAYKVKTNAAESIVLSGNEFNAGANAISLKKGWNWIGFPVNQTLSLDEAFAKSSPQEGDYITGQKGYAEYLTDGGWIGTLEVLTPGKGYMYQSTMDNSITYNTALVSNAKSRYGHAAVKRYVAPWAVNIYQYPNIMPVTADLFVDGVKADADAYTVAAFCGTECRGVGQYVKGVLFLSVYGDGNENITFYASDNATDEVYDITEQMPFAADRVGSYNAPFALHVGGKATEIAHLNAQFKVSPTVAHDVVTATLPSERIDRLTVVSTGGVPVLSQHNLSVPAQINVAALPEGIYIVVAVSEGKTYYKKIVKVN